VTESRGGPAGGEALWVQQLRAEVRARLRDQRATQVGLAEQLGITPKHMSQMLTGKVAGSPEMLEAMARAVGLQIVILDAGNLVPPALARRKPHRKAARCMLCQPPETVAQAALLDHLRLFHPGAYEHVAGEAARGNVVADPDPEPDAPFSQPVITAEEAAEGACCCDCGHEFSAGDRYAERLEGMTDWIPVVAVICMACAGPA
jgi:DNA-binding transcriptional regulator YdaS (Cro superfamily)